ncbi:MAG: SIS domain-containing protein [Endozoicomonas sp.]
MNSNNNQNTDLHEAMRTSVARQVQALQTLEQRINGEFSEALQLLTQCRGRAILFGMSQSGLIGQKIAATLYNAGLSSHLINPSDAWHDNLSMVGPGDIIIMLSYSGKTEELLRLSPGIRHLGNKVIAITGDPDGPVAAQADVVLDASVHEEKEEREFAPTTYTTVLLTIGDLLAEALQRFQAVNQQSLQKDQKIAWVRNIMSRDTFGRVAPDSKVGDVMQALTLSGAKICLVMDKEILCGVITDGDLRRRLSGVDSLSGLSARDIMNGSPVSIREEASVTEALNLMEKQHIRALVVQDASNKVIGVVTIDHCR